MHENDGLVVVEYDLTVQLLADKVNLAAAHVNQS